MNLRTELLDNFIYLLLAMRSIDQSNFTLALFQPYIIKKTISFNVDFVKNKGKFINNIKKILFDICYVF